MDGVRVLSNSEMLDTQRRSEILKTFSVQPACSGKHNVAHLVPFDAFNQLPHEAEFYPFG